MSKSYWGADIAYIGLAIAAVVGAATIIVALKPEPYASSYPTVQEEQSGYIAGGRKCEPAYLNRLSKRKRLDQADACAAAAYNAKNEANAIIQARRQAVAADASARFAYAQTRVGVWGLAFGFITMAAAIGAAWFAKRAAEETQRTADSAAQANNFSHIQMRPWIKPKATGAFIYRTDASMPFRVIYDLAAKNIGQSPAVNVDIQADVFPSLSNNSAAEKLKELLSDIRPSSEVIFPDEESRYRYQIDVKNGLIEGKEFHNLLLLIIVFYRTYGSDEIRSTPILYQMRFANIKAFMLKTLGEDMVVYLSPVTDPELHTI